VDEGLKAVHGRPPVFNVLYRGELLHRAPARAGELLRLEGRRGRVRAEVVVRPLRLPPFRGDVSRALVPVYADRVLDERLRALPGLELTREGRSHINNGIGYELRFQSVRPDVGVFGRDALLVPEDPRQRGGAPVLLSLRQTKPGGALSVGERTLAYRAWRSYLSFRFGTGRGTR
jgi:hypothetical protein